MRTVPYELMETICEALDLEPRFVSEIRFRAPREITAFVYRRDADGAKHLGDRGVVLERISFQIAGAAPVVVSGTLYGDDTKLREAFAGTAEEEFGARPDLTDAEAAEEASAK